MLRRVHLPYARRASLAVVFLAAIIGCQDLRALRDLSLALNGRFNVPMSINLVDGHELKIAVQDKRYLDASPDNQRSVALEIARFALANFSKSDGLRSITVTFSQVSGAGGLSVSRSKGSYSWSVAQLRIDGDSTTRPLGSDP